MVVLILMAAAAMMIFCRGRCGGGTGSRGPVPIVKTDHGPGSELGLEKCEDCPEKGHGGQKTGLHDPESVQGNGMYSGGGCNSARYVIGNDFAIDSAEGFVLAIGDRAGEYGRRHVEVLAARGHDHVEPAEVAVPGRETRADVSGANDAVEQMTREP